MSLGGLFGPVALFELVRTSRRGRFHLLRIVFVLSLLLAFRHFQARMVSWHDRPDFEDVAAERREKLTRFGETFLFAFLRVQFAAVVLVTPVWLGGAVAEEKDRRRLEFLLTTGLGNGDIVLGKLAAGLGSLGLLLLAGLPVLPMTQFLGGVDPNLVLQRDAMLGWSWPAWVADGNLLIVLYQVRVGWDGEIVCDTTLPTLLLHHGVFHGGLTLLCVERERHTRQPVERHTLDSLLTTPLTRGERRQAWGCPARLRRRLAGLRWRLRHGGAVVLGDVPSTRRATVWTLGTLALLRLGHWCRSFSSERQRR